ncbi:hypothetical protein HOP38_02730 [Vibrio mediterranei]|uniref:hypothetical protein n=1 Tax=Vibrio mediterranei TaxID=689 RepID=UPI00179A04CA|nr:hypothetical protein [Vibrio mediterranei]NUW71426.1 hypothetical protein [Vibrio mediterranei]
MNRKGPTVNPADYNSLGSIGQMLAGISSAVQTAYGQRPADYLQAGYLTPQEQNNAMYDLQQARDHDRSAARINEFMTGISSPDPQEQQAAAMNHPDLYNVYSQMNNKPQNTFKTENYGGRLFQNEYDPQGQLVNSQELTGPQAEAVQAEYAAAHQPKTAAPWHNAGAGTLYNEQTGEIQAIPGYKPPGQLQIEKENAKNATKLKTQGTAMYQNATDTLRAINSISDKELDAVTGLESRLPTFFNTTTNTEQKFKQLGSRAFMDNVTKMRGMGSLSNAEGGKISAASSALFDDEGNLKSGLSKEFVQNQLNQMRLSSMRLGEIGRFYTEQGREPTIDEYQALNDRLVQQIRGGNGGGNSPRKIGRFSVVEVQ